MNITKKTPKVHPFDRLNEWSVPILIPDLELRINYPPQEFFDGVCSLDVEDDEQGGFVGLGIYDNNSGNCYYWSDLELVKKLQIPKFIAHNGISDIRKLQKWGFKINESWLIWDTQLMAHIIDSSRKNYGLKHLIKQDLGMEFPTYEDICGRKTRKDYKTLAEFPAELVAEYNGTDTLGAYLLFQRQIKQLHYD